MTIDIPDAFIPWIEHCLDGDWSLTVDYASPPAATIDWDRQNELRRLLKLPLLERSDLEHVKSIRP